jgi:protein-disulfide isomerase
VITSPGYHTDGSGITITPMTKPLRRCRWIVAVIVLIASAPAWSQTAGAAKDRGPVAILGGTPIYEDELVATLQGQLLQLRNQEYDLKRRGLEALLNQKALEAAAAARHLTVDALIDDVVYSQVLEPTDVELQAFYLGQADKINRPYEEVSGQLRDGLRQLKRQQVLQTYVDSLRRAAGTVVLLSPPKFDLAPSLERVRGDARAPIVITEFGDFQCPFCARAQPTVHQLLEKYGGKVKVAFRDFPLTQIHPRAQAAAEAARCADEQGKFWDYHDRLYDNQARLADADLLSHASAIGLNTQRFSACLAGGGHKQQVNADLMEAKSLGLTGTPAFFINGIFLSGAQPLAAFEKIIDDELVRISHEPVR